MVDGTLFGQLSVDDCRAERSWTATETHAVSVLADLIGAAIARERHLEKLSQADEVVRNSPAIVYRFSADTSPPRLTYISDNVSVVRGPPSRTDCRPATVPRAYSTPTIVRP